VYIGRQIDQFYAQLDAAIADCKKNDLTVVLGDFNTVTGTNRLQGGTVLGPRGSGFPNENSDLFLSFCRGHNLIIAGSWFQRKDIHRFSWTSNDGIPRKEIDHVLSSCAKLVHQLVQSSLQFRCRLWSFSCVGNTEVKAEEISPSLKQMHTEVCTLQDDSSIILAVVKVP